MESRLNPESENILLVESGILGFGIRTTVQGIQNPTDDWNPESKFHWQRLESSIWNPESKSALRLVKLPSLKVICWKLTKI